MKLLVIIVAVLLMLAGGGISVMKTMEIGPFAPEVMEGEEGASSEDGESDEPKAEPPRFIDMAGLVIPIFKGDKVATSIQISLKLETLGIENEQKINRLMTRLNDAYLRDLYSYIPRLLRKKDRIDVFSVKKRLQMVSDRVAGPGVIDNVLVQSVTDSSRPPDRQ